MNRKGQFEPARKMIYWMIAGVVITILVLAFALITSSYQNKLTKVSPQLKAEFISLRFLNSPECFTYQDNGRVYPGVIDWDEFNEVNLNNCYKSGSTKAFNFQLVLDERTLSTDEWKNAGNLDTLFKQVLVRDKGKVKPATLKIYVQEKI
ncbi:hypothetical protein GOV03_02595 [Candidatus Woesearchaeota archaeon]|nr:hypothetical protein [Candidatus Woesearchaeota archaeon]